MAPEHDGVAPPGLDGNLLPEDDAAGGALAPVPHGHDAGAGGQVGAGRVHVVGLVDVPPRREGDGRGALRGVGVAGGVDVGLERAVAEEVDGRGRDGEAYPGGGLLDLGGHLGHRGGVGPLVPGLGREGGPLAAPAADVGALRGQAARGVVPRHGGLHHAEARSAHADDGLRLELGHALPLVVLDVVRGGLVLGAGVLYLRDVADAGLVGGLRDFRGDLGGHDLELGARLGGAGGVGGCGAPRGGLGALFKLDGGDGEDASRHALRRADEQAAHLGGRRRAEAEAQLVAPHLPGGGVEDGGEIPAVGGVELEVALVVHAEQVDVGEAQAVGALLVPRGPKREHVVAPLLQGRGGRGGDGAVGGGGGEREVEVGPDGGARVRAGLERARAPASPGVEVGLGGLALGQEVHARLGGGGLRGEPQGVGRGGAEVAVGRQPQAGGGVAYLALGHLPAVGAVRRAHEEAPRAEHLDPPAAGQEDARGEGFHLAHLAPEGGTLWRRRGGGGVAFEAEVELGGGLVEDGVDELGVGDVLRGGGPRAAHPEHRPCGAILARGAVLSILAGLAGVAFLSLLALFALLALRPLLALLAASGAAEGEREGARLAPFEVDDEELLRLVGRQGGGREGVGARGAERAPGRGAEAPVGAPLGGGGRGGFEGEGLGAALGVEADACGRERRGADGAVGRGGEGLGGGVGP